METSISTLVHDSAHEIAIPSGVGLAERLNSVLNRFLAWPFRAGSGRARDVDGQATDSFGTIIYTASASQPPVLPVEVSADALAVVIDTSEALDLDGLRAAYERVAEAKKLKKTPTPETNGVPRTTTLGIIFATRASASIEDFANELDHLNRHHPDGQWPDMVVVMSMGVISYAAQFPGEAASGDFFLSSRNVAGQGSDAVPIYVVMVMKASGEFTLNKMFGFLFAHLALFSPGANLPQWTEMLDGTPKEVITFWGYQYTLSGHLVPVPREFYNDRYFPPPPMRIEDQRGNVLSTIQFLPWQDGGVIVLRGKLPLEGILVFLGKEALQGRIIRRGDTQLSHVLPITQGDFRGMLERLQKQSNMQVRNDQTKWIVEKFADEGSTSPFIARLFMGNLRLRDVVFSNAVAREEFDKAYEFVIMTLFNTRATAHEIERLWSEHTAKISTGEIVQVAGQVVHIAEPIDKELRKQVEHFLNSAVRVLKQGMTQVTQTLQVDIGFLFQKPNAFSNGVAALSKADSALAKYLVETRGWSERLLLGRNAIEHEGWVLPKVVYLHESGHVRAEEPRVSNEPVTKFVSFVLDRLNSFVEEVTAHCLQLRMPAGISVTEVPLNKRDPQMPERFHTTLTAGGMPIWSIAYHTSTFVNT